MKRQRFNRIAGVLDGAAGAPLPGVEPGVELLGVLAPYVRHCGDSRRPAWRLGPRKLLDYLLVYIAGGHGQFEVDGVTYEARPDDLFWIPPDTPHAMAGFAPGMHCPYVHFDLVYRPSFSHWDFSIPGGMLDLNDFRALLHPPLKHPVLCALTGRIRGHANRRVGGLIRDICAEAARAQAFAGLRMSGMLLEAVAEILRGRQGLPSDCLAHVPLLEAAADEMARRCHENLPVPALARNCRLSSSHFRLLFQRHFGCAPRMFLRRARLRKARELMVGTALNLSEIANAVGFDSIHGFSRAFYEMEGVRPSAFRRCAEVKTRVEGRRTPHAGHGSKTAF